MNGNQIQVTSDDILVRPTFLPDGTLEGYFALLATDFANGTIRPSEGEIRSTPQEAVAEFTAHRWPELGARAFGRHWLATRSSYNSGSDFDDFAAAIGKAFPALLPDQHHSIAR